MAMYKSDLSDVLSATAVDHTVHVFVVAVE